MHKRTFFSPRHDVCLAFINCLAPCLYGLWLWQAAGALFGQTKGPLRLRLWWSMWYLQPGHRCPPIVHWRCAVQSGLHRRKVIWSCGLPSNESKHRNLGCQFYRACCQVMFQGVPRLHILVQTCWIMWIPASRLTRHVRMLQTSQLSWKSQTAPWILLANCCSGILKSGPAAWTAEKLTSWKADNHQSSVNSRANYQNPVIQHEIWNNFGKHAEKVSGGVLGTSLAGALLRETAHPQAASRRSHFPGRCFFVPWLAWNWKQLWNGTNLMYSAGVSSRFGQIRCLHSKPRSVEAEEAAGEELLWMERRSNDQHLPPAPSSESWAMVYVHSLPYIIIKDMHVHTAEGGASAKLWCALPSGHPCNELLPTTWRPISQSVAPLGCSWEASWSF